MTTTAPVATLPTFSHNIGYYTDDAQMRFSDFEKEIEDKSLWLGSRSTDYLVIFESESVKNQPYFKKSKLARMKKSCLEELHGDFACSGDIINECRHLDNPTKQDYIDDLLSVSNEAFYKHHFENQSWRDLDSDFTIRGYSQGDAVQVKLVGKVDAYLTSDYLTNIFFDVPLSGNVTIEQDGEVIEEFYLTELANFDEYAQFDKDDLLAKISEYASDKPYHDALIAYLAEEELNEVY